MSLGLKTIYQYLQTKGIKSILPRNLNQDSLENFFGSSRNIGCRNVNPSCHAFASSYKTLLLNNLMSIHSPGNNCEEDFATSCLSSYHEIFINSNTENSNTNENIVCHDFPQKPCIQNQHGINVEYLTSQTHTYISGYILKKINLLLLKNCSCLAQLCSTQSNNNHNLITAREYSQTFISLKYPNKIFCSLVQKVIDLVSEKLPTICHTLNLKATLINIVFKLINLNILKCQLHEQMFGQIFLNFTIKFLIYNFCNSVNKILNGKQSINKNENDPIKISAYERYVKYSKYKHLKNRKF